MKKIYILIFLILAATGGFAQTVHDVTVSNFEFDPEIITIDQGDIVVWTNVDGSHNVDGSIATFPNNPTGFENEVNVDPWTFEFTFETAGGYDYRCAAHPFMTGRVIVQGVNSTENGSKKVLHAYPTPADDYIVVQGLEEFPGQSQIEIFDITGKKVMETLISPNERINISSLNPGIYLFNVITESNNRFTGKIVAQ